MRSNKLRHKYFNDACEALQKILRPPQVGYVCPLCLRLFRNLTDLSLEHVPPKSRGGKPICLTCKYCNSTAGHTIDVAVQRDLSLKQFLKRGGDGVRSKLKIDSIDLNVVVRRDSKGVHITIPDGINPPEAVAASKPAFDKAIRNGLKFTLSKSVRVRKHDVDVGYLKSAYLAAFAKLGYRWILASRLDRIRKQIVEPSAKHLRNFRLYLKHEMPFVHGIYLINEPITCLLVTEKKSVIVLPWIDAPMQDIYDSLKAERPNAPSVAFSGTRGCPWPTGLELRLDQLRSSASEQAEGNGGQGRN